jgi:hypothetical protein
MMIRYGIIIYALTVGLSFARLNPLFSVNGKYTVKENKLKKINISTAKRPRKYTLVDDEDFEYLNQWKWYPHIVSGKYYARRSKTKDEIEDNPHESKSIYMHRVIIKCPEGYEIDHIDMNPLNNQKSNLRVCRSYENACNKKKQSKLFRYKGLAKSGNRWTSKIRFKNKIYYLGLYKFKKDAAKAYNCAAKILHGEYAYLNKI